MVLAAIASSGPTIAFRIRYPAGGWNSIVAVLPASHPKLTVPPGWENAFGWLAMPRKSDHAWGPKFMNAVSVSNMKPQNATMTELTRETADEGTPYLAAYHGLSEDRDEHHRAERKRPDDDGGPALSKYHRHQSAAAAIPTAP